MSKKELIILLLFAGNWLIGITELALSVIDDEIMGRPGNNRSYIFPFVYPFPSTRWLELYNLNVIFVDEM